MRNRQAPRRMVGWNYAGPGYYFITFVTWQRRRILATMRGGRSMLTPAGIAVQESWQAIPERYPEVVLDAFVVMPDHVHGVLAIHGHTRAPVSVIVGTWKAATTRAIRHSGYLGGGSIWQRNYFERVIRSALELDRTRAYIRNNPLADSRNNFNS